MQLDNINTLARIKDEHCNEKPFANVSECRVPDATVACDMYRTGVRHLMNFLLDQEADAICGVKRGVRSKQRMNSRIGFHPYRIRMRMGAVDVRVPNLRWIHVRPRMCKRAKRLEARLVEILEGGLRADVEAGRVAALIKDLWTIELPADLHSELTKKSVVLLKKWRRQALKSAMPGHDGMGPLHAEPEDAVAGNAPEPFPIITSSPDSPDDAKTQPQACASGLTYAVY